MGTFKSGSDLAPTSGRPRRGSPWSAWEFPTQAAPHEILQVIARQSTGLGTQEYARRGPVVSRHRACARSSRDRAEFRRCRTSARRVVRAHRSPRHPAARGAGHPAYEFQDPDRRRGRRVHGCLDREPARAARLARADGKRTRLSRGDARSSTARRHADPLCRQAHLCHSDGRTAARYQFHGVRRKRRRTRPAKISAIASAPWRARLSIAVPTARVGLDHDRCFPTIFRASVVVERTSIFYAVGHQHIGLTLAPVTGELIVRSGRRSSAQTRHLRFRSAAILGCLALLVPGTSIAPTRGLTPR